MEEKVILIVEDEKQPRESLVQEIGNAFPNYKILTAETLQDARAILNQHALLALVTDNSFPFGESYETSKQMESEFGGKSWTHIHVGLELIKELRAGNFGEANRNAPVFYQSGGMSEVLEEIAHELPGFIQCYSKSNMNLGKRIARDLKTALDHPEQKPIPYKTVYNEGRDEYMASMGLVDIPRKKSPPVELPVDRKPGLLERLGALWPGRKK